jgi:hypothetical protein
MGKNKVIAETVFLHKKIAQSPYTCPCINDDNVIVFCPDFDTGGVATIFDKFFPGNRYGAP